MNSNTFFVVRVTFWMWIMIGKDKAKKRVLHSEEIRVDDNHVLSDIDNSVNRMLSDFRSLNYGIVHSDIYVSWSVHG